MKFIVGFVAGVVATVVSIYLLIRTPVQELLEMSGLDSCPGCDRDLLAPDDVRQVDGVSYCEVCALLIEEASG